MVFMLSKSAALSSLFRRKNFMTDSPIRAGEVRAFGKLPAPQFTPELIALIKIGKV